MQFAIFIYEGTEPIDLATYGVLSMARRIEPAIRMFTVAERAGNVALANGLTVVADHGFDECPPADVLIITGGPGWPQQSKNTKTLDFIRRFAEREQNTVASVCTGGMILAATGLLNGKHATTKRHIVEPEEQPLLLLRNQYPDVQVEEARLIDEGRIVTAGGVSLCIDATLYLLQRFYGEKVAAETARILEYEVAWAANAKALQTIVARG
jgi:transcriptional regulator GlxA family with amidase domain